MRLAAFDVGTNTTLACVVERDASGRVGRVSDRARITRLGEAVDRTGRLHPEAIARTLAALRELASAARGEGATVLVGVGTSALRDAENRAEFVEEARRLLDRFDVVDGLEEASLTFAGALFGLEPCVGPYTVVDIGGGSTEVARRSPSGAVEGLSLDVGSVRLFERHLRGEDPPSPLALAAVRAEVERALSGVVIAPPLVMLAGTATNLAAVALGRDLRRGADVPHGAWLSRADVDGAVARITTSTGADRRRMAGIEDGREDVIVAGALLLDGIVRHASADRVLVSDGGVRYGLALSTAALLPR